MDSSNASCNNCAASGRSCDYNLNSWSCQRCMDLHLQDCDIADTIANLPRETSFTAGQSTRTTLKKEPAPPSQYSKPSDPKWEGLVKGDYVLVLGVDIGTKNSSASWQLVPKNQKLTPRFKFQVRNIESAGEWRIPTQAAIIVENDQPRLIFSEAEILDRMGEGLESQDVFTLLKLMLVRTSTDDNDGERQMVDALQRANNFTAEKYLRAGRLPTDVHNVLDIFREFLRYLWSIIRGKIASVARISEEELEYALQKHTRIIVAVPAIWTAPMNNHFRRILLDAGFPCAHIRSEPKLAAAVILQDQQHDSGMTTTAVKRAKILERSKQTARLVVDIGGGTTDLSCIQIVQIWPVLKFRTLMVGVGSMSGSELLNSFFSDKLSQILSDDLIRIANFVDMTCDEVLKSFVQGFENAKRKFSGDTTGMVKINFEPVRQVGSSLPKISGLNIGARFIRISVADIREVFEKYLGKIKALISSQVSEVRRRNFPGVERIAIMLVGAGSLIPYLREELSEEYTRQGIEVTQHEDNSCSLVAKGAALAAIDPTLGLREFARTTYGTVFSIEYNPEVPYHVADKHLRERAPRYIDWIWELPDRFQAVIKHGTNLVNPSEPVMINETIDFRAQDVKWPLELEHKIYQVDDPAWGLKDEFWSIHEAKTRVVHAATLTMKIPKDQCTFKSRVVNGTRRYEVGFRARPVWDGLCEQWLFFVHPSGKKIVTQEDEDECFCVAHALDDVMAVETMEGVEHEQEIASDARGWGSSAGR